jgi:hypothetical protein
MFAPNKQKKKTQTTYQLTYNRFVSPLTNKSTIKKNINVLYRERASALT